jgi:hypothetical protein
MSETTNPAPAAGADEALSFNDGADAIAGLLADPETDLQTEDQGQDEEADAEAEPEEGEEPETEEVAEEADADEKTDEEDGPEGEVKGGKFAADAANVRLKDGTVISVQDLKRGYLAQQAFTRGTQDNAKERETLAATKAEVDQYARSLHEQRDLILQVAQQYLPQPPDRSLLDRNSTSFDPVTYAALKAEYDDRIGILNQLHTATKSDQDRAVQDQVAHKEQVRKAEVQRLLELMPDLAKPEVQKKFWADTVETMSEYGFSQEELNESNDHRVYQIFRDLTAYRKARNRIPAVKEAIQSRPVLTGKRRMDPKEKTSRDRQARTETLRKTGSFDAGVGALMDLDL